MFVGSLIALGIVAAVVVVALNAGRIPGLRDLIGSAPLQPQEPDHARDFAATDAAGYIETPEQFAARMDREGR